VVSGCKSFTEQGKLISTKFIIILTLILDGLQLKLHITLMVNSVLNMVVFK